MFTVHIEHPVQDFDRWKVVFDGFTDLRTRRRVRRYEVSRPPDDPRYVLVRLDFDSRVDAEGFLATMREVWGTSSAATVLAGAPRARVTESVEVGP